MFKRWQVLVLLPLLLQYCFLLQKSQPTPEKLLDADQSWAETTLQNMSLDQKIGQMIFVGSDKSYINELDLAFDALKKLVLRYKVGGIVFSDGNAFQHTLVINNLQSDAQIPLMIAADLNAGVGEKLAGGTRLLSPLGLAATGDPKNAYTSAKITALEARALGYHLIFSPTLSLYNPLADPEENLASFGSDPHVVAGYSLEFMRGLQDYGILAAAKYFPVNTVSPGQSPGEIPVNFKTIQELQVDELLPFVELVKNKVAMVMTAHTALPNYDIGFKRPATFSPYLVNDLLKTKLQFEGLVISDRLNKSAITDHYYDGTAAVEAIIAGVDVLIMPTNFQATFHAIREAVQDQRISINRIDQSVKKILMWKSVLGLDRNPLVYPAELTRKLQQPLFLENARKLAQQAITLCKNENVPLSLDQGRAIYLLGFSANESVASPANQLESFLFSYNPDLVSDNVDNHSVTLQKDSILSRARHADVIVNVIYLQPGPAPSTELLDLIRDIQTLKQPVVNIIIGPPSQASFFPNAKNLIFTFSDAPFSYQAAADALFGKADIQGKLPVSVGNIIRGSGETIPHRQVPLSVVDYHSILPHPIYVDSLKMYLEAAIADSAFPGCAIVSGYQGRIFLQEAFGNFTYDPRSRKMATNVLFDLASLTKVVATTTTTMMFYDRDELHLDWKVADIIPEFKGNNKDKITIRHLLTHTSGLPGWKQFYLKFRGKEQVVQEICNTELIYEPGSKSVYSDLGMILMQRILETISQKPLDLLVRENLTTPLNMNRTMYNPDRSLLNDIVPTEISEWHGGLVRGVVHDENTLVMGGVSGHAGLFSTVEDLSHFCMMYLAGGTYDYNNLIKPQTIRLFTSRQNLVAGSTRALGWDTRAESHSMAGELMSMGAFGHSGFTGTTIWMDPVNEVFVVLLTNRVYPTRDNHKISRVRPKVHDYIMKAVLK
ncbi:MAG: hypothetical protein E4H13_06235 [Calditrichales bacterium]|nr:MAG: hypothetical protein E4H13_06235 [Calditrichales bacterium]